MNAKPQKQTYYPSYNSGYLEYILTSTTERVEINNISFMVDQIVAYKNTILTGGIEVTTLIDDIPVNVVNVDIKVIASNPFSTHTTPSSSVNQLP
ncbi:MAG: hypothetical protein LBG59_10110 [Candidatus Peribacteria bacterium]|nr:hypothetical protein [Candidatus Peribacteria bacterium]